MKKKRAKTPCGYDCGMTDRGTYYHCPVCHNKKK